MQIDVHFSFRWFAAKMLLTVKSWKFWTKKTFTSSLRVGFVNHDIQRNFALCFTYACLRSFSLWKTTWISRRWFCTFSDTYGSILHIFFPHETLVFLHKSPPTKAKHFHLVWLSILGKDCYGLLTLASLPSLLDLFLPSLAIWSFSHQSINMPITIFCLPW